MSKLSIVVPNLNGGAYISDTLSSLILQKKTANVEVIVKDGLSSDDSLDIISDYQEHLDHVIVQPDSGQADALNQGFAYATGDILAWINSDDFYLPGALAEVVSIFEVYPEIDWLIFRPSIYNKNGIIARVDSCFKSKYDYLSMNFSDPWIQQESSFWRRSLFESAGPYLDAGKKLMCDGELWSRFFLSSTPIFVDSIVSGYRSHGTNRAGIYYDECINEMHSILSIMRKRATQSDREKARMLYSIRSNFFSKYPSSFDSPSEFGAFVKSFHPGLYEIASYSVLRWNFSTHQYVRLPQLL